MASAQMYSRNQFWQENVDRKLKTIILHISLVSILQSADTVSAHSHRIAIIYIFPAILM